VSAPFESESPESSPAAEVPRRAGQDVVPPAGDPGRACEVELPQFEGPLDLLLHLVRRHELDILDIPIAFVCEKYLEYLEFMRALDLEVAGDYLVMAATLAYLKSRELVPQDPTQ
jgi:segregation and condensation protein A